MRHAIGGFTSKLLYKVKSYIFSSCYLCDRPHPSMTGLYCKKCSDGLDKNHKMYVEQLQEIVGAMNVASAELKASVIYERQTALRDKIQEMLSKTPDIHEKVTTIGRHVDIRDAARGCMNSFGLLVCVILAIQTGIFLTRVIDTLR
jgi:hypothetical protein